MDNSSCLNVEPLSQLTKSEQARLLEELNYMNLEEIRAFCSERGIPYRIVAEYPNGKVKATKDTDRKPIVLARVRRYLTTGQAGQPTRIPATIVREESPPARLEPRDRLYYRWYAKEFEGVMRLLRDLTAGRFRDGAVARVRRDGVLDARRSAHVRGVRPIVDESQGRGAPAAHAGVRLPDRPRAPARRRRLEGLAQGEGQVRSGDAFENRSRASGLAIGSRHGSQAAILWNPARSRHPGLSIRSTWCPWNARCASASRLAATPSWHPSALAGWARSTGHTMLQLGREVAIKVLPSAVSRDPERLIRFEREARLLASLNHPNIATLHGVERLAASTPTAPTVIHALVLELVEGETLAERLSRVTGGVAAASTRKSGVHGGLPPVDAFSIARQIADAVDAAHERGIVHRDLKPANIKISPRRGREGARLRSGEGRGS